MMNIFEFRCRLDKYFFQRAHSKTKTGFRQTMNVQFQNSTGEKRISPQRSKSLDSRDKHQMVSKAILIKFRAAVEFQFQKPQSSYR